MDHCDTFIVCMIQLLKCSGLVLGSGFGLGLDTVFISGSKLSIQLGYVLGLGYGLSLDTGFHI
eukprot:12096000-Ditylum_brightwellii.AAC.1